MTNKFRHSVRGRLIAWGKRNKAEQWEHKKAKHHRYILAKILTELDAHKTIELRQIGTALWLSTQKANDITNFERLIFDDIIDFCIGQKKFHI